MSPALLVCSLENSRKPPLLTSQNRICSKASGHKSPSGPNIITGVSLWCPSNYDTIPRAIQHLLSLIVSHSTFTTSCKPANHCNGRPNPDITIPPSHEITHNRTNFHRKSRCKKEREATISPLVRPQSR